jgi:hypothetical protein
LHRWTRMKLRLALAAALVVSGCVAAPFVPDELPTHLTSGKACSLEVLPFPPTGPYETLSRIEMRSVSSGNLELLAAEGCKQGADAIVVPVPPTSLRPAAPCVVEPS